MAPDTLALARSDWRPGEADRLLLQAVLLPGQPGQAAWRAWSARVKLDDVGSAAYRLLPELYQTLAARGDESSDLARLKGIGRKTWYENQLRRSRLQDMVATLSTIRIEPLVLRGAEAAGPAGAADMARNTSDQGCAVRLAETPAALEALARQGWLPTQPGAIPQRHWPLLWNLALRGPGGHEPIQFAWRLPWGDANGQTLAAIYQRALPITVGDRPARVPDQTDRLWLACLDGVVWRAEPDWRWVVDAVRLVQGRAVDWAQLVETCRRTVTILPVREALRFLALALQAPVPTAMLGQLQSAVVAPAEARRFALISRRQGRLGAARRRWEQYVTLAEGRPSLPGFVRFLEAGWALGSGREVLREAARRGWMGVEPTYHL